MPGSKFAASRRPGKTPAICKKVPPPEPGTIPDPDRPIIHPKPLYCSIEWRSISPAHPWLYAQRQILTYRGSATWRSTGSLDPLFELDIAFFYLYPRPQYSWLTTIRHDGHALHTATAPWSPYQNGNAFYLPRQQLDTSPYPRYQCNVGLSI
jgi:hypothetical protein